MRNSQATKGVAVSPLGGEYQRFFKLGFYRHGQGSRPFPPVARYNNRGLKKVSSGLLSGWPINDTRTAEAVFEGVDDAVARPDEESVSSVFMRTFLWLRALGAASTGNAVGEAGNLGRG